MAVFDILYPSPILAPYVRYYWMLNMSDALQTAERITPVGCANLIFHRADRMHSSAINDLQPQSFLCGLSTGFTDLTSKGSLNMIVTVFEPFGAGAFFPIPMSEFKGCDISIDDIGDKKLKELEDQLWNETDNNTCVSLIENYLIQQLHTFKNYNYKRIRATVDAVNTQSQIKITALADIACLSYKQFNRVFTEHIGVNPKDFSRIVRFQRALYMLQLNQVISLTQLALECGYYDQSHLIKEFKAFSGYTPGEYLAICSPHSDYFSQP